MRSLIPNVPRVAASTPFLVLPLLLASGCLRDAYQQTIAITVGEDGPTTTIETGDDVDTDETTSPDESTSTDEITTTETESSSAPSESESDSTTDDVPASCGDGALDPGEECDDGNLSNGDSCLNTCAIARCGDGHIYDSHEECDDGNAENEDTCSNQCSLAACGDGIVQAKLGEECDDPDDETCNACHRDRLMFVTSTKTTGALGGLSGADYFCQMHADEAGIGGDRKYMAWLSTADATPTTRFFHSPGRYVRTDGEVVSDSFDDLIDGLLWSLPSYDENGEYSAMADAWSNTDEFGERVSDVDHCEGWTSADLMAGDKGRYGVPIDLDWWSDDGDNIANPAYCDSDNGLYCFEQ